MPSKEQTRKKVRGLLKKLRDSGVKILFEGEGGVSSGGVNVSFRGQEVYVAPLEGRAGLFFNYHDICGRGGLGIKAMSTGYVPSVSLDDGTIYHAYKNSQLVPEDVLRLLERGHEFSEGYMKKLNGQC